jgi:hypothetical protein
MRFERKVLYFNKSIKALCIKHWITYGEEYGGSAEAFATLAFATFTKYIPEADVVPRELYNKLKKKYKELREKIKNMKQKRGFN